MTHSVIANSHSLFFSFKHSFSFRFSNFAVPREVTILPGNPEYRFPELFFILSI